MRDPSRLATKTPPSKPPPSRGTRPWNASWLPSDRQAILPGSPETHLSPTGMRSIRIRRGRRLLRPAPAEFSPRPGGLRTKRGKCLQIGLPRGYDGAPPRSGGSRGTRGGPPSAALAGADDFWSPGMSYSLTMEIPVTRGGPCTQPSEIDCRSRASACSSSSAHERHPATCPLGPWLRRRLLARACRRPGLRDRPVPDRGASTRSGTAGEQLGGPRNRHHRRRGSSSSGDGLSARRQAECARLAHSVVCPNNTRVRRGDGSRMEPEWSSARRYGCRRPRTPPRSAPARPRRPRSRARLPSRPCVELARRRRRSARLLQERLCLLERRVGLVEPWVGGARDADPVADRCHAGKSGKSSLLSTFTGSARAIALKRSQGAHDHQLGS
jgi:hypothetical protein